MNENRSGFLAAKMNGEEIRPSTGSISRCLSLVATYVYVEALLVTLLYARFVKMAAPGYSAEEHAAAVSHGALRPWGVADSAVGSSELSARVPERAQLIRV